MATNKVKNTTAAKPRRFGVGIVLSCVQSLRRRPKPPQVLERSLATTVRRGSGRKTVPLDLELVDMPSTSLDGGGDVNYIGAGESEEISSIVQKPNNNGDELRSMGKLRTDSKNETPEISSARYHGLDKEGITEKLSESATDEVAKTVTADHLLNNNNTLDQSLASPQQETAQNMTQNADGLAENSTKVNAGNFSGDQHISRDELRSMGKLSTDSKKETPEITSAPTLVLDKENTAKLAGSATNEVAKTVAEDHLLKNNDILDQSLASLEQETAQNMTEKTEDLAGNSTKLHAAGNFSGDQYINLDQSDKEETDEITPLLSEQIETQMKSDDPTMQIHTSSFDAQLIRLLHSSLPNKAAENFEETMDQNIEDSAVNIKQKEFVPVPISNDNQESNEIPTNQHSENWKQDLEAESADNIGEESKASLPTSSPLPLFREFLPAEIFEETIDQNTEDSAVNTKQNEFIPIPISNDDQESSKIPTNQHSEYWKQDLEAELADNIGEESKASLPTSSPLPLFREFLTADNFEETIRNFEETIHQITEDSAKNTQQKELIPVSSSNDDKKTNKIATNQHSDYWKQDLIANNPALAESTDNIGEESKSSLRTSSPLSLFREFLTAWSSQYRSPYAYLLSLPIGMAVIFLVILSAWGILLFILVFAAVVAILLSVGVCALLLFAVSAVAGTGMLSVWAGTLWALWISGRVGFAAIKLLVSSVSRASSAFNL